MARIILVSIVTVSYSSSVQLHICVLMFLLTLVSSEIKDNYVHSSFFFL